jgi:hypothetical protein
MPGLRNTNWADGLPRRFIHHTGAGFSGKPKRKEFTGVAKAKDEFTVPENREKPTLKDRVLKILLWDFAGESGPSIDITNLKKYFDFADMLPIVDALKELEKDGYLERNDGGGVYLSKKAIDYGEQKSI